VAQAEGEYILERAKAVDLVFGPQAYHELPEMIIKATGERVVNTSLGVDTKFDTLPTESLNHGVAAYLSVQEGCDKFCTFCVVPYTRGAEYSRPVAQVLLEAQKLADKVKAGKNFDLDDFKMQMSQMRKMGGMGALMDKMPSQMAGMAAKMDPNDADKAVRRIEGIINSMTPLERRKPELIKATRKKRIADGSGVQVQEVNRLLKQFEETQKMMKMFAKGGMAKMMRSMGSLMGGKMPGMR
jgi:radical SAM superfamily enzyme YgiQ (UPF0313 family)